MVSGDLWSRDFPYFDLAQVEIATIDLYKDLYNRRSVQVYINNKLTFTIKVRNNQEVITDSIKLANSSG